MKTIRTCTYRHELDLAITTISGTLTLDNPAPTFEPRLLIIAVLYAKLLQHICELRRDR